MATLELTVEQDASALPARRGRRLGLLFWFAIGWVILMFAVAIFADVLPLPSPTDMDMLERRAAFSAAHWLGTDGLGRDELSRLIHGARISLLVGLSAPVIGLVLGGALGMLSLSSFVLFAEIGPSAFKLQASDVRWRSVRAGTSVPSCLPNSCSAAFGQGQAHSGKRGQRRSWAP